MSNTKTPIRIGLMGFGRIGRQVYDLASHSADIDVVTIADIGKPAILHYLLCAETNTPQHYSLDGNFLVSPRCRTRMTQIDSPHEVPWDLFAVDAVIDCTGKFRDRLSMQAHLDGGAPRVVMRTLPLDAPDRIVVPGVNQSDIMITDRILSAGSATTNALCLLLHMVARTYAIECVSMTTVHCYTSDQSLQDYAGRDFRRSRSAAENVIPNTHEAERWIEQVLPSFAGKVMTNTLNVPVHSGCMIDTNLVLNDADIDAEAFNAVIRERAKAYPGIVAVTDDPIVSSDVLGSTLSLLFDVPGTQKAGTHIIKALGWYAYLGHAARLLDVVRLYRALDLKEAA
jgi:glyceraldehyde 3-phosphate dehydrogenase